MWHLYGMAMSFYLSVRSFVFLSPMKFVKSSATCKHQTASCGSSYWLMLLLLVLLVSVHHNNKCHRDTLYSWHVIVHNKYLPDCPGTLRQPWHHNTTNPIKNQTTLRQHKPQPRHLTSTKSDPGFKSRFLD